MHCPSCAHDNAMTTRFCAECGGVLVEDARRGFARRLLRRRPPPARVEPTAEPTAGLRRVRRFEWTLAGIVAVGMVAAYLSHPVGSTSAVVVGDAEFVPLPAPASARKSDGADGGSTTIVEPLPGPTSLADSIAASRPERTARVENADRERRKAASRQVRVEPQLDVAPDPAPTKEAEKPQVVAAAPAPPQPDRWAIMQQDLARCGEQGFFDRLACDHKVRLANCEGLWGQVPLCPGPHVVDYTR
jgi:hypothetical protein